MFGSHRYNIIITPAVNVHDNSNVNNVKIIKNGIPLILKSVTKTSRNSANVILTDNSSDYDIDTSCGSTSNNDWYKISNIFTDFGSWQSGDGGASVYLNFEMPLLSEIYFYACHNVNDSGDHSWSQSKSCKIKVLCDDNVILNTNLENLKWRDRIRIIFDEYDKCHTNVVNI